MNHRFQDGGAPVPVIRVVRPGAAGVKRLGPSRTHAGTRFGLQNVHGGTVSIRQRGCLRWCWRALGTGGRCGQSGARRRRRRPVALGRLSGGRGGEHGRSPGEAGGGAGPAELLSARPHLALRPGPVPTQADRSRPEPRQREDAGGAGGVRLQGLPACGGLPRPGRRAAGELGEARWNYHHIQARFRSKPQPNPTKNNLSPSIYGAV